MKVLAIGNSFSEDSMEYLYEILRALGEKDITLGNLVIGGCPIEKHVFNAETDAPAYSYRKNVDGEWVKTPEYKSMDALRSEEWEYISMQQASRYSGLIDSYEKLPNLMEFARKHSNAKVKFFWHMTWSYQQSVTHEAFNNYENDQLKMYFSIINAVKNLILPNKEFAFIVPNGTAIQNARTSYLGDTLTRDGFHLSIPLGRYIAGLTWARMLTGKSVRGISYAPEGVDEHMKEIAIDAVEYAVQNPFEITALF